MKESKSGGAVAAGCVGMILLVPVLTFVSVIIGGFVVQALWEWFISPLGLPNIGMLHAAGIAGLFHFMCPFIDTTDLAKKEGYSANAALVGKLLMLLVFRPAITLLIGYFLHSYMG